MTKKNQYKKALISSVIALMLCFSMLVGTTFAWFTDSVSSAKNKIVAGNLDIELEWSTDMTSWEAVDVNTNVFSNANWEPGHTEVVYLRISNQGSLALKYQLGVNIASETPGTNAKGDEFYLSEYIKYAVVDMEVAVEGSATEMFETAAAYEDRADAVEVAENTAATLRNHPYVSETTVLDAKDGANDADYVALIVYMPENVGDEANYRSIIVPFINLGINLVATQTSAELDSFGSDYDADAMTFVKNAAEAQAALDNATEGMTIKLAAGVDYGTLYLRPYDGGVATKNVDWIGNNYGWETYTLFENLTIVGAEGATVDAIKIEGGTYYHTEHSQDDAYPVMLSLVELKNVVIDGVTFTGNGGYDPQGYGNAINLSGNNIKVDGLTLKNCTLDNAANNARLIYKTESTTHVHTYEYSGETYTFSPTLKNITVTGCTFDGGYMGLELRETENLTITNNVFNVADRNILLPVNTDSTYTGTITITGNVSNNAQERFVRADGMGDAVVVIKNNTINNYMGADEDYIKVTNGNNVTTENNPMTRAYKVANVDELKAALVDANDGDSILLAAVDFGNVDLVNTTNNGHRYSYADYTIKNLTIAGQNGTTFSKLRLGENDDASVVMTGWTFKNIEFIGDGLIFGINNADVTVEGCRFTDTELQNTGSNFNLATNFTVKDCTFNGAHATRKTQLALQNNNGIMVTGCTFINAAHNAMNITGVQGAVIIEGNTINETADRALRFAISNANATLSITNNTIVSGGDDDGELMKVDGSVTADNITLSGNTWNDKTDSQVFAGMIGSNYIVK